MPKPITSIAVFCGSRESTNPMHAQAARSLGKALANATIRLVFGGGNIGIMGELSSAAAEAGGQVLGVIPRHFIEVVDMRDDIEMVIVDTMHQRKALMYESADAFIVLPGGIGTLDEFFEVWTWRSIGMHAKPIGILDIDNFFAPLLAFIEKVVNQGYLPSDQYKDLCRSESIPELLSMLALKEPPLRLKLPEHRARHT